MTAIREEQPTTAEQARHHSDRPLLAFDCHIRLSLTRALPTDALTVALIALLLLRAFMH